MSTNILLTGASGFIGNAFVNKLINQNNRGLTNFKIFYLRRPNRKVNIAGAEPIDLENNSQDSFNKALCNNNFDYVYNFASYGVKRSDNDITEYIDGNITFLARLIRGFLQPPKLFINIGSCAEYGFIKNGVKVNEEDSIRPNSLYAASKAAALDFGVNVAKDKDIPFIHLRLFGVYGEGEYSKRLLPDIYKNLSQNNKVKLTSGTQIRDWIYIDDVIEALYCVLNINISDITKDLIYNICSGEGSSVKEVVSILCNELDASSDLLGWGEINRNDEPEWLVGSPKKFQLISGWKPKVSLEDGIKKSADFFKINH